MTERSESRTTRIFGVLTLVVNSHLSPLTSLVNSRSCALMVFRVCFGDPDHDRVMRIKTWLYAPKRLGPHDLVTPVHGFENRVYHLILGPGHRSLTAGGKKYQFYQFYHSYCF